MYPDFVGYVNDYAHLLSAPQASALNQELRDFDNRTTIEVAVVTVDSIGSESPGDYAVNIGDYWGVGKRDKNNGIVFLVAMESHDIWIEAGPGLSGQISDRQVQQIVDTVVIPQFRADRPDLGVINGIHSVIGHFEGSTIPDTTVPVYSSPQEVGINPFKNPTVLIMAIAVPLILVLIILSVFGIQARKNSVKFQDLKNRLNEMVDTEMAAHEALKELKAQYVVSVWERTEKEFDLGGRLRLELDLELENAERTVMKGFLSASTARSQMSELEQRIEKTYGNIHAPIRKLAEVRNAQEECAAILAGLDAAFLYAEKESKGDQIAMATRMNLAEARHEYLEAASRAKQPVGTVNWIVLLEELEKLRETVEQVSKDEARDRGIAETIKGRDPEEMLARMKKTLTDAEKIRGSVDNRSYDLKDAWEEYHKARNYRSGNMNEIDLYLLMRSIEIIVEQRHVSAVEKATAPARDHERATPVHHEGFGSSGSDSFGGGDMGGGSSGGGKW
jgi:uncharacterized membrane protein YgcG